MYDDFASIMSREAKKPYRYYKRCKYCGSTNLDRSNYKKTGTACNNCGSWLG